MVGIRRFWRPISVLSKSELKLLLQEVLHLIGAMRWSTTLHECEVFIQIHCVNSRDCIIMEMLQVGDSDSISPNKERLTNSFPVYDSGYHNLSRKFVSFAVQVFPLQTFLGTIETNSIILAISW